MTKDQSNHQDKLRPDWPSAAANPLTTPLQMSAAYRASDPDDLDSLYEGQKEGYTYAREGHPNADVLARMIDNLEGQPGGIVTSSGMSAISVALLAVLKQGDHIIAGDQLYGRSLALLNDELPNLGISATLIDVTDETAMRSAVRENTRAILLEVVSNPTLTVANVVAASAIAKEHGLSLIVDNTFTTPFGFQPWDFGADIVVHSITKLMAGHSDVTLGYVAAKDPNLSERLRKLVTTLGLTPSPFDCWMAERGLYTFRLRFDAATRNAQGLAKALKELPEVVQVFYPNIETTPVIEGRPLLLSSGNMLSFRIAGGRAAAVAFIRAATPVAFAPTLGDVSTTISHPASSSHRGLTEKGRLDLGIDEGFFRVSVGLEDADWIIERFRAGVQAAANA